MRSVKLVTLAAAIAAFATSPAFAAPDRTVTIFAGQQYSWQGVPATGLNLSHDGNLQAYGLSAGGTCDKTPRYYCDTTLLEFSNPVPADDADGKLSRLVTASIESSGPVPYADFDLYAFQSDSNGTVGPELDRSAALEPTETVGVSLMTTRTQPSKWVLLRVVYYTSVESGYTGTISG